MRKIKKVTPCLFLIFVFITVIFSFRANPFSNVLSGHDSSMFLYFGKGISDGLIPYKDMLDHKGPILFIIQYLAVLAGFGNFSLGIWLIECLFFLGTLFFLYKTCYLCINDKLISAVSVTFLTPLFILCYDGGNYSEEFALLFISISLYFFCKIFFKRRVSRVEYLLIGFLGAATFFIRLNMISLWVVFCLFLVYINLKDKNKKLLFQQVKYIFLGGITLTILIIAISLFQNNLEEMFYQAFIMNISYSNSNLSEKINTAFAFIELLLKSGVFSLVVIFFVSILQKRVGQKNRFYFVLCIYFVVNFVTVVLSGRYYTHYLVTQFAPLVIMIAFALQFIVSTIAGRKRNLLAVIILLTMIIPITISSVRTYNFGFNLKPSLDTEQTKIISEYINKNSKKSDTIYVHNINANIYLLSDRYSNSRYFVLPSINYDNFPSMKKEFVRNLYFNRPKFIVVRKQLLSDGSTSSNLNNEVLKALKNYDQIITVKSDNYLLFKDNH
ncbi:prepilin-type cleavage/methylation protein [Enterococcus avium]|uniref:prepilin-type cleavage/methylation protein n=1 Tax=Enterococcus avium TaxID=33945 RepID=UPI00288DD0CC|nr:prepilin-type cleavage/methylation protein [Enterococcus avium]MDT2459915.1 prepilin-type cleavage/methylation protein [Enterococcus avium]MDT2564458.1 prepilin-type cleavage/methylation protein [Enterococcus avium]